MRVFPKGEAGAGTANALFSRYLKSVVVNGAAANTNIAIAGLDPRVDEIISVVGLTGGALKQASAAGAGTTALTVTGITTSDKLIQVLKFAGAVAGPTGIVTDITATTTIASADTLTLGASCASTDRIFVLWEDYSFGDADFTSSASISSYGNMRVSVSTVGSRLHVLYTKRGVR